MIQLNYNCFVKWTSYIKYVDLQTGEEITKQNAQTNYIKIKTKKHATLNATQTHGTVEYTIECRRKPQLNLFKTH